MTRIEISPSSDRLEAPGALDLQVSAPGKSWVGIPLGIGDLSSVPEPRAAAEWFTISQLPLPSIVNLDGQGRANVQVDVAEALTARAGDYSVVFTAGYATDSAECPTIKITISTVSVPNLKGKLIAAARAALTEVGLSLGTVSGLTDADCEIVSQHPEPGVRVPATSAVAVEAEPAAVPASAVHVFNCWVSKVDIWLNDRTTGSWQKWPGSPVPGSVQVDCPPVGVEPAAIALTDGHYYALQAASTIGQFDPGWSHNFRFAEVMLGSESAPIVHVNIKD